MECRRRPHVPLKTCISWPKGDLSTVRLTLKDFSNSRAPKALGLCTGDYPRLAEYVNEGTQRLINAGSENGWWGGWSKVVFNVSRNDPYITLPTEFARIIGADVCRMPVRIQNEWYEFLEAGIGLRTQCDGKNGCGALEMFERGVWSTAYELTSSNQLLRVYITDVRDIGKRILFENAKDQNGNGIYSQDINYPVIGFYLTLNQPFTTSTMIVTSFSGVQKDETYGDVVLKEVDATTGVERFLARYGPSDTSPQYRRYFINRAPNGCCFNGDPSTPAQITCMAKHEFRPVSRPTDHLLISNIPALIQECQCIRHEGMDDPTAAAMSVKEHREAIRLLNQELDHYLGTIQPALNIAPWGTAHLHRQRIGSMM